MSFHSKSLGEIAADQAGAGAVLRRWGLDYCCEGGVSLEAAAAQHGLDVGAICADLESATPAEPAAPTDTGRLIAHIIERYHNTHERELADAIVLAARVEGVHSGDEACPHGLADHLQLMLDEMEAHHQKEEAVIFPAMLRGVGPALRMPLARMMSEHNDIRDQVGVLAALTRGFQAPPHACTSWKLLYTLARKLDADLREHMHLENNVLFRRYAGAN
jgi:regulator of cell morphogenesis and NO signaling